ncbi:MAG: toprim domain-containing protein [Chloroflexi bacterium]|nr:toprim domain-containing protein [Chloroflexota bacterium]
MPPDLRYAFGQPRGRQVIHVACPLHQDDSPSLAVYPDHGWCFSCGVYFTPPQLLDLAGTSGDDLPAAAAQAREDAPPPAPSLVAAWQQTLLHQHSPRHHRLAYLTGRGLRLDTIRQARLGHTGTRFAIPVVNKRGVAIGVKFRRDDDYCDPDAPKYLHPPGQPPLVYRPLPRGRIKAIAEGEFDALLLSQYGIDAMTTLAGADSLVNVFGGWSFRQPVFICTDLDDAGEKAAAALAQVISAPQVKRVRWPSGNDVTEALLALPEYRRADALWSWFS